jgi:hypothetical protein
MRKRIGKIYFDKEAVLKKGILFDKDDNPVIIDGVAQRDLKSGEELFWYGDTYYHYDPNKDFPTDIVKTYGNPGKGKPLHVIPKPRMMRGNL